MAETPTDPAKLTRVVTWLEMREAPRRAAFLPRAGKHALMRLEEPSASFYRYLYETVGERWFWYERRSLDDGALEAVIRHPDVEIFVLYVGGGPVGFAELDWRDPPDIELARIGLVPDRIGQGLGAYLLTWVIDEAWRREPPRLWTRLTSLDHPRAAGVLQRAGFSPYKQDTEDIDDPRAAGLIPAHVRLPGEADAG